MRKEDEYIWEMPRKIIPLLALFILLAVSARASDTLSRYRFVFASGGYASNYEHPYQNYRTGVSLNVGVQAVRQGKGAWGLEYGISYYQGWFYSFLIPATTTNSAYYRRYTETYLCFPLLARKLFVRGDRHYFVSFGPEFYVGLLAGRTDIDGIDNAVWVFPESAGMQPSLFAGQLAGGCDFKGPHGKYFRLGIVFRSGIAPFNVNNYGKSSIPFSVGGLFSFSFDPDKQAEKRERRKE